MQETTEEIKENPLISSERVKKSRSEAQKRATEKMQNRRKETLANRDGDFAEAAEELRQEKVKRRKEKRDDLDSLIEQKMEKYHVKFLDEINKPLEGMWSSFLEEEEPVAEPVKKVVESPAVKTNQQIWEEERKKIQEVNNLKRNAFSATPSNGLSSHANRNQKHDFSRFF